MHWILAIAVLTLCTQHVNSATCNAYQGGRSTIFGTQVHRYACCNNCYDLDSSCAGTTYQGGSDEDYCNHCGTSWWSGTRYLRNFNCPNCDSQSSCKSSCSHWNWPLGCWCWLNCFIGCCGRANSNGKRDVTQMTFCGDGVCEDGETVETCPMDCCYRVNSACTLKEGGCTPECCGEPTCCLGGARNSTTPGLTVANNGMNLHVVLALTVTMVMMFAFFIVL